MRPGLSIVARDTAARGVGLFGAANSVFCSRFSQGQYNGRAMRMLVKCGSPWVATALYAGFTMTLGVLRLRALTRDCFVALCASRDDTRRTLFSRHQYIAPRAATGQRHSTRPFRTPTYQS